MIIGITRLVEGPDTNRYFPGLHGTKIHNDCSAVISKTYRASVPPLCNDYSAVV